MSEMKKRWIALYVENDVGVLAKVSGLFSGKSYNLQSLTVGTTEDETGQRAGQRQLPQHWCRSRRVPEW